LPGEAQRKVLGENALRFYGLAVERMHPDGNHL